AATVTSSGVLTAGDRLNTPIEIRNGTRARNLAHQTRSLLSLEGFTVGIIGNHIDFGAEATVIYYRPEAEKVARVLNSEIFPGARLTPSAKLNQGTAIKVVLGRDLLERPRLMSRLAADQP
ncbi:MAG: LytR C-terminal domain-containing protein, partial [Deltaproteobacteria bacterium]|nr:LytR C-terminal domain-containing protein [Deltaproteobacteria bacterium]